MTHSNCPATPPSGQPTTAGLLSLLIKAINGQAMRMVAAERDACFSAESEVTCAHRDG